MLFAALHMSVVGTLRRIAAMHKCRELSEVQRTCHELVGGYQSDVKTRLRHRPATHVAVAKTVLSPYQVLV
jgi:hypothetical protein